MHKLAADSVNPANKPVRNNLLKQTFQWLPCHPNRVAIAALTLMTLTLSAQATELVVNGSFEQLLMPGVAAEFGDRYPTQQVIGWTTSGYNFLFTSGSADTTLSTGEFGPLGLWGPSSGSDNGLPASSPDGGNFVGMDGSFGQSPVEQTIHGLTPGKATVVSLWWAGAQQSGFHGVNSEQFAVSLGSETHFTGTVTNADMGFSGWQHEALTFTPTSSTEVLSFLAFGTPSGVPPFSLLDGVSIDGAPEPATWGMGIVSLLGMIGLAWFRRRRSAASHSSSNV